MAESPKPLTYSISTGTILKVFACVIVIGLLIYLRDVVLILLTSVVIASAIEPGTVFLVKRKIPRILAVVLIYVCIIVVIAGLSYLIVPPFLSDLGGFTNMLPKYVTALNIDTRQTNLSTWQSALVGLSKSESLGEAVQNFTTSLSTASGSVFAFVTTLFGGVISFLLVAVLSFYLAVQEHGVENFLLLVIPLKQEHYIVDLWRRTQHKIGRWMQGQFILGAFIGVLVFFVLLVLRVRHPLFLALISGLLEIIPVFGPIIGSVPGVLTAFLQSGVTFAVIVAVMYLIVQQIESNIVYPLVFKKILDIHPLLILLSLAVGFRLGGFLGILLSVPVSVALTEFMDDIRKDRVAIRQQIAARRAAVEAAAEAAKEASS